MKTSMNDKEIRTALIKLLFRQHPKPPDTLILEELGLRHGAARIDVAVLNGKLHGFEVKSDSDTLKRLPIQASIYNSVLDKVTLVATERHLGEALKIIPKWWGVKVAKLGRRGGVRLSDSREASKNPNQNILQVSKLLWREEALNLLVELEAACGMYSKRRGEIYLRLVEVTKPEFVRSRVYEQLKNRIIRLFGGQQKLNDD